MSPSARRRAASVNRTYIGLVHKDAGSDYGVSFPDLPGCVTAGATLEEARGAAGDALAAVRPSLRAGSPLGAAFGVRLLCGGLVGFDLRVHLCGALFDAAPLLGREAFGEVAIGAMSAHGRNDSSAPRRASRAPIRASLACMRRRRML